MSKITHIHSWLSNFITKSNDKRYRHRLLKENLKQRNAIINELKSYVDMAHEDARQYLRKLAGTSLEPLDGYSDPSKGYPEILHPKTLKGYFGEIFSAIIAENFAPFEEDNWKVPAFLFRFHSVVFQQLESLRQTGGEANIRPGRTGDDCLAFKLNDEEQIIQVLYCEAKCTSKHYSNMITDAHKKVSESEIVDILPIIDILREKNDATSRMWIDALRQIRLFPNYERCNLVSYVCGEFPKIEQTWMTTDKPHPEYKSGQRLESVEVHLHDVDTLIKDVYGRVRIKQWSNQDKTMVQPSEKTLNLAKKLKKELASPSLSPSFAKLYSQHTRLREGQLGLSGWQKDEAAHRLNDAMRLIEVAFIEKESNIENWQEGMRRAGELLEWLSHPQLNSDKLPLRLLAAAAYQLAGYPARSTGLLNEDKADVVESKILHFLLKADFPHLFRQLTEYWATLFLSSTQNKELSGDEQEVFSDNLQQLIVKETASSLGILCAVMRWGEESRLEKALNKLTYVSKILIYGKDTYSWLLAKLCAEVAYIYMKSSMRVTLQELYQNFNERGKATFEQYIRLNYQENKSLLWNSQIRGIKCLITGNSFALCTPTGSGKTTVAELAILQSIFINQQDYDLFSEMNPALLVIYMVPSRALATEVEVKLNRVFRRIRQPTIQVTGLYGGTDWGPTDAWLTANEPTVLICTYEKAEALIRFLGTIFLSRVSLIVIDEAHSVQFNDKVIELQKSENRPLRLESLGTRLFTYLEQSRIIALSAVAAGAENAIASWVTGEVNTHATSIPYRSTRQLIGRLECLPNRKFEIRYDLLDNANLQFGGNNQENSPFIPNPFSPHPPAPSDWEEKVEKRLRPYLFWAAMHMATPDDKGQQRAVLISVTQHIGGYAEDFITLIEKNWANIKKPKFFEKPTNKDKLELWDRCLRSCADYYRNTSREYRLLEKGVVVHHGQMPGLMARLLIEVIHERIIHLVLATSTLSEGVNLPFETVLIPTLRRGKENLSISEFNNLVGRAGRPGFGTEGRTLVLLQPEFQLQPELQLQLEFQLQPELHNNNTREAWSIKNSRKTYFDLIKLIDKLKTSKETIVQSPLAKLLVSIQQQWQKLTGLKDQKNFMRWLEETAPLKLDTEIDTEIPAAVESLDSLDNILLSNIVEIEQINNQELTSDELESRLRKIWQRSYAYYAHRQEKQLENIFVRRGQSLKTRIYPEASQRRQLYRTSLPPRSGNKLLQNYSSIVDLLNAGKQYATCTDNNKLRYIVFVVDELKSLPKFSFDNLKKDKKEIWWQEILSWWLNPSQAKWPEDKQISDWHKYVSQKFGYLFNWGLGSIIALAIEKTHEGKFRELSLETWPLTGLPWIVFWLKELIVWGTLEPVAAYLLAKGMEFTRAEAEKVAQEYYTEQVRNQPADEQLNAVKIRDWVMKRYNGKKILHPKPFSKIKISLLRDFSKTQKRYWKVVPVETGNEIHWLEPAGFPIAICNKPENWNADYLEIYDFHLDVMKEIVLLDNYTD
jgi:replicative superfamily II helicase